MADDVVITKLAAGSFGAFVSMRFVQGTPLERMMMGIGGAAVSYFGTTPVAQWVQTNQSAEGLIGFLLGVFGMSIISKVYEVIALLDAKQAAQDLWDGIVRKWKA